MSVKGGKDTIKSHVEALVLSMVDLLSIDVLSLSSSLFALSNNPITSNIRKFDLGVC